MRGSNDYVPSVLFELFPKESEIDASSVNIFQEKKTERICNKQRFFSRLSRKK
jgi:hypothetical protein